ncbi:MAG: guanine deaminase [Pseudomonadota bacterium]
MNKDSSVAYRARIIHSTGPSAVTDVADGMLVVDGSGRIVSCGPFDASFGGKITDMRGRLIIPGLVDVHSHIPQLDVRGKHGSTLLSWLDRYIFPAERSFANPKVVEDVATRFFKKLILNGTTTAGLYATVHADATDRCFEIARAAGVRCFIGKVMMDQHSPEGLIESTADSLAKSEALCAKWHGAEGGRLMYAYTPRFAPTCSLKLLEEAGKLARGSGAYLQSHIAETRDENARVRELYPQFKDYVDLFERTGCLGEKSILAHAIYLSDDEFKRLASSGTKVAHCPTSNFFLKSGWMPVSKVESARVVYGLGTDVGAGTSMSMFTEMRHADYMQLEMEMTPAKVFYLATLGGARVLSQGRETGNLEKGKSADFCVVDIAGIDPNYRLSELDTDEVLSLLMYRGSGGAIESTHVGGKKLDVDFA